MSNRDSQITYHSQERRNALRVKPTDHKLRFLHNELVLPCIDISVLGVGLAIEDDVLLEVNEGDIVAFVLDQDDQIIGQIKARLIHRTHNHSGWQFTATEDSVLEFIDELVLDTQKAELKRAALERLKQDEKDLLDSELDK